MPITTAFTSRRAAKGEGHIHTDKWHRCIEHVKAQGGGYEPHAVCTASIGYSGSINPEHRTKGPHASTKHRKKKYDEVLKYNPNHSQEDGQFISGPGGAGAKAPESGSTAVKRTAAQQAMQDALEKQDKKPIFKVKTPEEAVVRILKGENVELQDTKAVHTVLAELGKMAIRAKELKRDAPNWDPCTITVKGTSLFCSEKIRTEEFPHGIPRIEMPQFKSKNPVPGSPADKLPRNAEGEVDATDEFLKAMAAAGVKSKSTTVLARKLKASQAQMEGVKVAGMMLAKERNPKTARITVTTDTYVVDGHHTWAAAVGRDAEDGNLDNDMEMEVVMIDMPMSKVYHAAVAWTKKFGLPAVGVKKRDFLRILIATKENVHVTSNA